MSKKVLKSQDISQFNNKIKIKLKNGK